MKTKPGTEMAIANMIDATYGKNLTMREKHIFSEALRSLVRLAKSEKVFEMKKDVKKSIKKTSAAH